MIEQMPICLFSCRSVEELPNVVAPLYSKYFSPKSSSTYVKLLKEKRNISDYTVF